ncbi:DUF47 domain-containing protein [Halorubrum vacuolatum]|uniref:DUF47 family protein n=1 Tax=Halorubrum vacuolatum TaxID=63740 RepID=A0A238WM58_HALVU|nr:DUF47 family protein [Halorubrum vacuolatum]SNR47622.1 hypothetical protein SAMN06264855_108147 [Halorubrum vacuolatum]
MTSEAGFGERLETLTETYVERLEACAALLPELCERYASDGDYSGTLARIESLESEADDLVREITAMITDAGADDIGLLNTRINFNQSALLDLYGDLDIVANHTERIAQEVVMTRPDPEREPFARLREMGEEVVAMAETLADVVVRFVRGLARADTSENITDGIESIRAAESRCDTLRNAAIEAAFEDGATAEALLQRELAILLDELANAMEDLTDAMVIIASKEPGVIAGDNGS